SAGYTFNGSAVARVGDRTTCGAVIESGAEHFLIEGAAVARKGDRTDHGGVLDEGDAGWLLE
ncbi:PAAR domain-containing protein, partial [Pseudomonas sp. p99-361]